MLLKINDREYKVKFGYKTLAQSDILAKIMKISEIKDETDAEIIITAIVPLLPELLLMGLQKYNDEFVFDVENEEERKEKLNMVYDLIDDYIDSDTDEDRSMMSLFMGLTNELVNNGFLSSKSQMVAKKTRTAKTKEQ